LNKAACLIALITEQKQLNHEAMKRKLMPFLTLLIAALTASGQTPEMYPPPVPEPLELTTLNVILYIVIPVLLVIFLIYYRRRRKRR